MGADGVQSETPESIRTVDGYRGFGYQVACMGTYSLTADHGEVGFAVYAI